MAKSLDQLRMQRAAGGSLSSGEQAQLAFLTAVEGKQRISAHFYDTITIPAAGLGTVAAPATTQAFSGANAGNLLLTNFQSRTQLEQDEYADLVGISVTPLVPISVVDGASAAALAANRAADVDAIIKNLVVVMRLGTNEYGPYLAQSCGGDGGLGVSLSNAANIAPPSETIFTSANNGEPKPGNYWHWNFFVRWPGNKQLIVNLTGGTGPLSADTKVRIAVHAAPYYRNFRPETGLHFAG
jgi:hypothetical protein